jgi:hypothetical protein
MEERVEAETDKIIIIYVTSKVERKLHVLDSFPLKAVSQNEKIHHTFHFCHPTSLWIL